MQHTEWDLKKTLALELCSLFQTHWDHRVYRMKRRNTHTNHLNVSYAMFLLLPGFHFLLTANSPALTCRFRQAKRTTHREKPHTQCHAEKWRGCHQSSSWAKPADDGFPNSEPCQSPSFPQEPDGTCFTCSPNLIPGTLAVSKPPEPSIPFVKGTQCLNAFRNRPGPPQASPKAYRCWGKSKI